MSTAARVCLCKFKHHQTSHRLNTDQFLRSVVHLHPTMNTPVCLCKHGLHRQTGVKVCACKDRFRLPLPLLICSRTQKINTESELLTSILCGPSGGFTHFSRSAVQSMVLKNGHPLMAAILPDAPSRLFWFLVRN
jgi:hypothetical protein